MEGREGRWWGSLARGHATTAAIALLKRLTRGAGRRAGGCEILNIAQRVHPLKALHHLHSAAHNHHTLGLWRRLRDSSQGEAGVVGGGQPRRGGQQPAAWQWAAARGSAHLLVVGTAGCSSAAARKACCRLARGALCNPLGCLPAHASWLPPLLLLRAPLALRGADCRTQHMRLRLAEGHRTLSPAVAGTPCAQHTEGAVATPPLTCGSGPYAGGAALPAAAGAMPAEAAGWPGKEAQQMQDQVSRAAAAARPGPRHAASGAWMVCEQRRQDLGITSACTGWWALVVGFGGGRTGVQ